MTDAEIEQLFDMRDFRQPGPDDPMPDPGTLNRIAHRMLAVSREGRVDQSLRPILRVVPRGHLGTTGATPAMIAEWTRHAPLQVETPWLRIVIPVRGAHDELMLCLEDLRQSYLADQVVIVCPEQEAGEIERRVQQMPIFPCIVAAPGDPRTFAENCNLGFEAVCAVGTPPEVVVFLNSDTDPHASAIMGCAAAVSARSAENPDTRVVACGPMGTNVSGAQCVELGSNVTWAFGVGTPALATPNPPQRLVGFCMAVSAEAFRMVGGFSHSFGNNFEDDDLCWRLRAAYGMRSLAINLNVLVEHKGQASFAALGATAHQEAMERASAVFVRRYGWLSPR